MPIQQYKLQYLPLFYDDLFQIVTYIQRKLVNPEAAETLVNSIETAIKERSYCAESFEPYPSTRDREHPY